MQKRLMMILSMFTIFIFTGCLSNGTVISTSSGTGAKGPFVQGSIVKAYKLENNGSRSTTVTELSTTTSDNLGTYSFPSITWSGATELEISGNYLNENTGTTTQSGTLSSIVNVVSGEALTANINVLTNLAATRTKVLMLSGNTLASARTDAQASVLALFGLTLGSDVELDDLDLTDGSGTNSAANAELLRISAAIAATPTVLASLENAIADGNVTNDSNGSTAFAALSQAVNDVNFTRVSANIAALEGVTDAPVSSDTTTIATFASNANAPVMATVGAKSYTISTVAQTVTLNATDADGDTVTFFSPISSNSNVVSVTLSGSTLSLVPKEVGTSTITVTVTDGSLIDIETFLVTVIAITNSAPVLSDIADTSKTYGDSAFTVGLTATDVDADSITYSVSSSDINVATVSISGSTITVTPISAGTTTVTATANDGTVSVDKTMTINVAQRPITITADAKTKVYGDVNPTLTYSISPTLVSGDSLSGALDRVSGEDVNNTYAITLGTLANSNYDITFDSTPISLTITKAILTATVNASSKIQGTANPTFEASFSGFKNSDTSSLLSSLVFLTTADTSSAVGDYAVTLNSFVATNYSLGTVTGANLTVTAVVAAKLSDPYIIGAVLYQDDNNNQVWDSGEPESSVTTATGDFTFSVPLTAGKSIRIKTQGKHEGVTYDTNLVAVIDSNGDVKAVTPLTTFTSKGLTTQQLADILNYAATNTPDGVGGTAPLSVDGGTWQIVATNLNLDPLSSGGDLLNVDLTTLTATPTKLTDLQASLTTYALLKIFEGSTTLKAMDAATLYSEGTSLTGSVYTLTTNMLEGVTGALNSALLTTIESNMVTLRDALIANIAAVDSANVITLAPTPTTDMLAKIAVTVMEKIATDGYEACNAETGDVGAKVTAALTAVGTTAPTLQAKILEVALKLYGLKYATELNSNTSVSTVLGAAGTEAGYLLTGMSAASNGAVTFRFDASNNVVALDTNGAVVSTTP